CDCTTLPKTSCANFKRRSASSFPRSRQPGTSRKVSQNRSQPAQGCNQVRQGSPYAWLRELFVVGSAWKSCDQTPGARQFCRFWTGKGTVRHQSNSSDQGLVLARKMRSPATQSASRHSSFYFDAGQVTPIPMLKTREIPRMGAISGSKLTAVIEKN